MYPANGFAIAIIPQAYQRIIAKQIYAIAQPLYFTTQSSSLHGQPWSVPIKRPSSILFLVQETGNAVHYQSTQKGAIIPADGVQMEALSISVH
jgi:hypothetical protein